ncbi:MAG: class I SAM-dependent methyltransferase [Acidobacteriaceae bacterium]
MAAQPQPISSRPYQIRPWRLFTALAAPPIDRLAQVPIPSGRAYGNITLLESFILVATMRLVHAQRLFEFGTFLGRTTFILALNSAPSAHIFTLDFDAATDPSILQHEADAGLTAMHRNANALDFMGTPVEDKVTLLNGDSLRFDFSLYHGQMDWIFIDAGHDRVSVQSDTENALRMINRDRPSCIAWHDYQNPEYPDLTGYLDELSRQEPLFHVADSKVCLWINDPARALVPALLA